jgi:hypothetical protein
MREPVPDDLARSHANFATFRAKLASAKPDALVVLGSDHLRKFVFDNSPAFCIGKAERFACTYENEVRTFGLDTWEVPGDPDLAGSLLGGSELSGGFDFAMSNEWLLDHSFSIPLVYLTDLDIPVVPIHGNTNIPPVPTAGRFAELGRHLAEAIAADPSSKRVALIASGHLATEVGGPRHFLGGDSPDAEFDESAVAWMRDGDLAGAIAGCTLGRVLAAGNVTGQYLNFIAALSAVGGRPAAFAEGTPSRFAAGPFFWWEMA